jgi:hypothetical protein
MFLKYASRFPLIVVLLFVGQNLLAQLGSNSQEVWPSIDAFYRFNDTWRLYGTTAATKRDESSYSDGALGLFVDYFTYPFTKVFRPQHADSLPGRFMWLRAGYQYSATPPSSEDPFKESMIVTEANARYNLPFNMLLTWKNRMDWRIKNGEFDARYRPRLQVERDMRTEYLFFTAYGWTEYYANIGNSSVNRFKMQFGVELRVLKQMNYEIFWNHQFSHEPEVQEVDAFGMTLKIYLDKSDFKKKKKEKKEQPTKQK